MIADMIRVVVGLAAWVAGTMIAVSVASFGANVVLRNAGASPGMPVISGVPPAQAATPPTVPPAPPLTVVPAKSTPAASATASTHPPAASASPSSSPSQPAATGPSATQPSGASPTATAGRLRDYTLAGGRITLDLTQDAVQLVTAIPDAGYSVQTWSGTDWLRVDFSSGPQVSSLIASWYEHAPSVTVTN
jgi:hypothetical protein